MTWTMRKIELIGYGALVILLIAVSNRLLTLSSDDDTRPIVLSAVQRARYQKDDRTAQIEYLQFLRAVGEVARTVHSQRE